ncbi:sensor histidine kinase [Rugosimonospora africana]|uniref:histidine kinase n=1 Tax=Rugosimonospora africana TaxID=556532 RepID=A0A8J3R3P2_9ACTN|nr:histidine kinase [Rugosimonospora africana]GIH21307.1 two-component sensor histidine kinase [Rugosimonospora africana]
MSGSLRRGRGDGLRDAVAVAAALAAGAVLVSVGDATGPVPGRVPWQVDVATGVAACFALLVRRRWPMALSVLVVPLGAISVMANGAILGAVFGLALRRRFAVAAGFAAGYLATVPLYLLLQREPRLPLWTDVVVRGVLVTAAVGWGLYARERQALIRHLGERAARAEAEQTTRVAQARRDERDRIAREMHDVLAHRLSMISLHAGAMELHPDVGADVHEAAGVIRAGAHEALEELRAVIGVLRHDTGDEPEPPQPGLEAVGELVRDARRCGNVVRFDDGLADAQVPSPPGATGRIAYRVVQEALTNVRKHAPGSPVRLVMDGAPGEGLRIEVSNPASVGAATRSVPGSGLGLVGLAERVELAGGRLVRGTAAGRFRLEVRLPWLM